MKSMLVYVFKYIYVMKLLFGRVPNRSNMIVDFIIEVEGIVTYDVLNETTSMKSSS